MIVPFSKTSKANPRSQLKRPRTARAEDLHEARVGLPNATLVSLPLWPERFAALYAGHLRDKPTPGHSLHRRLLTGGLVLAY